MKRSAGLARWAAIGVVLLCAGLPVQAASAQAPANDAFAAATVIPGASGAPTATTTDATKEAGEPSHAGNPGGASLWWQWTAAADGPVVVNTCSVSFDTLLAVYTGTDVAALTPVADSDDACAGDIGGSQLTFAATAGVTYSIAVDGFAGATGGLILNLNSQQAAPVNDSFAAATVLSGAAAAASGTNLAAGSETGESAHRGLPPRTSVWWRWTAPFTGTATADFCASTFDPVLDVYTGGSLNTLTSIGATAALCPASLGSVLTFAAIGGQTYSLVVDGFEGEGGGIALKLDLTPPPVPPPEPLPIVAAPPPPPPPPPPATQQQPAPIAQPGCALKGFVVVGTDGADARAGGAGIDIIFGRAGDDALRGGGADDCLYGEAGADRLSGGAGDDRLFGGTGADRINGGAGSDRISGSAGDDTLTGGAGGDRLSGGGGRDRILARDGRRDTISCGPGRDAVTADRRDQVAGDCERVARR